MGKLFEFNRSPGEIHMIKAYNARVDVVVTIWTRLLDVLGSNPCKFSGTPNWSLPWDSSHPSRKFPDNIWSRLRSLPSKSLPIHLSHYYSMLLLSSYWQGRKLPICRRGQLRAGLSTLSGSWRQHKKKRTLWVQVSAKASPLNSLLCWRCLFIQNFRDVRSSGELWATNWLCWPIGSELNTRQIRTHRTA